MDESPASNHEAVTFTIDGRPFSTGQPNQTPAALLTLAGLDPNGYDLGEFRPGQADPKVFEDEQHIHVKNGDKFVSIRERAEVA